jgi:nicotinamide phosphoribosyltransferase
MLNRPHLALDGYKTGHKFQYPAGTEYVYANLTARSHNHFKALPGYDGKVVFVMLQAFIQEFLIDAWDAGFFHRPKDIVVAEYKRRMDTYLGPDAVDVSHIAALHDLGYLPLLIKALPEGSRVDTKVPFLTIQNTHPGFFWLTNYIETILSAELWKPITVATIAYEYRRILNQYVELTGSDTGFADWQLHDFSMRGMSGLHDAAKSGSAHLMAAGHGTDTLPAIDYIEQYYYASASQELIGGSVPATEHSVMCMGGKDDGELATFRRLITETYPSGVVSIVSDTWDFWNVITNTARTLKDEILARTPNALGLAKVVFRPDSGDPVKIIAGLRVAKYGIIEEDNCFNYDVVEKDGKYYEFDTDWCGSSCNCFYGVTLGREVPEHEVKGAVECLWDIFGGDVTAKGYKTLNQRVGLIYGDSITLQRAEEILKRLAAKGFSAGNIVFGIGSYAYQYNTRDTFGMAVKATYGVVNGEGRELFKDPVTDNGVKKSAKGLLRVEKEGGKFVLYDQQSYQQERSGELRIVFHDGSASSVQSYAEIVARIKGN